MLICCSLLQPAAPRCQRISSSSTRTSAHSNSSRLRQLVPDLIADAVVTEVLPGTPLVLPSHPESGAPHSDSNPAAATSLDAYPGVLHSPAAAWTASDDADIDHAAQALLPPGYLQQQQQQQQQQQRRREPRQTLPHPVLTALPETMWAQQQQQEKQQDEDIHIAAAVSSSSSRMQWRSLQAENPAPDTTAAAAAAAAAAQPAAAELVAHPAESTDSQAAGVGGFFGSRADMLQQLQQQQLQVHREHVLSRQRQQLYRYTMSEGSSSIKKLRPRAAAVSPLRQTTFALVKQPPAPPAQLPMPSSTTPASSSPAAQLAAPRAQQQQPQPQQQQQQQQQGGVPAGLDAAAAAAAGASTSRPHSQQQDPSRGLCLSAFLYCCSRQQLLSTAWQLGLSPSALRFVSRVADADLVLHVKPGRGERHYQYEQYRAQAADKGIPFVDLKNLSLLELQLYLLPVFRLYAGEVSPRDLLLRRKRRHGHRGQRRYASIKLPPAKPRA